MKACYNLKAFGALLTEQLCPSDQPLVLPLRKLPLQKLQLLLGSGVTIWHGHLVLRLTFDPRKPW